MTQAAHLAILLVLGAAIGALGGLVGIGGGLFAIPVLGVFFGLDEQHAQGTALVMVVPNVAIGLWNYAKRAKMDPRIGWTLALTAAPLTYAGARVATGIPSGTLRVAFALFTFAIALTMIWRIVRPERADAPRRTTPWPYASIVGALGGVLSGFFSVGGAIFAVPMLSWLFGLPQAAAQGFGLALVAPGTIVGIVAYALAGDVDWAIGVPLALGSIFAVPYGVKLAYALPERGLRAAFVGLTVVASIALMLKH